MRRHAERICSRTMRSSGICFKCDVRRRCTGLATGPASLSTRSSMTVLLIKLLSSLAGIGGGLSEGVRSSETYRPLYFKCIGGRFARGGQQLAGQTSCEGPYRPIASLEFAGFRRSSINSRIIATKRGCVPTVPARTMGMCNSSHSWRASTSKSYRTSRWSERNPIGAMTTPVKLGLTAPLPDGLAHIRLEPWLLGRAAPALVHQLPLRMPQPLADQFGRLPQLPHVVTALRHAQRNAVRGEQELNTVPLVRRKLVQGISNPCFRRFDEAGMIVKHPQFVDLRRARSRLRAGGRDVLPVLAASRIGAVSRRDVGQCPPPAVGHHLPHRIAKKRMPIPIAPVNREIDLMTPKLLLRGPQSAPATGS